MPLGGEGDQTRISEIYAEHKSLMLRCAMSIVRDKGTAEDAVHDAFLAIMRHKEKIFALPCRDLPAYLVTITKNKCIDIVRQRGRDSHAELDCLENTIESRDAPIEDQIVRSEEYDTLRRHVAALDEASILVLEMKYGLGMTYKEIGKALGMTPKHVDTKIMRAKEKVRRLVTADSNRDE
jgi:RNA polymerase sigma-70 factor (ECF subfamily)